MGKLNHPFCPKRQKVFLNASFLHSDLCLRGARMDQQTDKAFYLDVNEYLKFQGNHINILEITAIYIYD